VQREPERQLVGIPTISDELLMVVNYPALARRIQTALSWKAAPPKGAMA
jgi:hypothetical protein